MNAAPVFGFGRQPAQAFATVKQGGFYRCGLRSIAAGIGLPFPKGAS
jgi:hypothetical protein